METELFMRHRRGDVFVETGSYYGEGIQSALDAGFAMVMSVELSSELYLHCKHRFARERRVRLFWGDSSDMLQKMISRVNKPMTFWLDGHWSGGSTARGRESYPILKELAIIATHKRKDHHVLIDDSRKFTGRRGVPSVRDVEKALLSINDSYEISRDAKGVPGARHDVIVARIPACGLP